ncbi:hypothetical protein D3C80_890330 [compost metagenome]
MVNISECGLHQLVPGSVSLNAMNQHEGDDLGAVFDIGNLHVDQRVEQFLMLRAQLFTDDLQLQESLFRNRVFPSTSDEGDNFDWSQSSTSR